MQGHGDRHRALQARCDEAPLLWRAAWMLTTVTLGSLAPCSRHWYAYLAQECNAASARCKRTIDNQQFG